MTINPLSTPLGKIISLLIIAVSISACHEGSVRTTTTYSYQDTYHDGYHEDYYEEEIIVTEIYYAPLRPPELVQFHMIDTYGVNTEFDDYTALALSPYINSGYFEIFWDIHSEQDYFVELYLNDIPSPDHGRLIMTEYCGPGLDCDDYQYQYCEYTNGLSLLCENTFGDVQAEYVGDMLETIPDDQYLVLQVCDTSFFDCEYQALAVSME